MKYITIPRGNSGHQKKCHIHSEKGFRGDQRLVWSLCDWGFEPSKVKFSDEPVNEVCKNCAVRYEKQQKGSKK